MKKQQTTQEAFEDFSNALKALGKLLKKEMLTKSFITILGVAFVVTEAIALYTHFFK